MAAAADPDVAIELAHRTLVVVAPEELPLFAVTSEMYRRDPGAVEGRGDGDEVLGFGAEAITALTPVLLAVGSEVARFLLEQVRAVAADETQGTLKAMVHRLLGGPKADGVPEPAPLTAEQLRRVRAVAFERARRLKLPEEQAQLLADAMVGGLVTA